MIYYAQKIQSGGDIMESLKQLNLLKLLREHQDLLFLGPLIWFIAWNLLLITTFPIPAIFAPISKVPLIFVLIKIALDLYSRKYTKNQLLYILPLVVVSILVGLIGGQNYILYYLILTLGALNIPIDRMVRVTLKTVGIIFLITLLSAAVGLIENRIFYREDGYTARLALGIQYPTDAASLIFYLYGMYLMIRHQRLQRVDTFIGFILAFLTYLLTGTRLDAILLVVLSLIAVASRRQWANRLGTWLAWSVPIMALISLGLAAYYSDTDNLWQFVDHLLSGRLRLGQQALESYPLTFFGQVIQMNGFGQFDPSKPYNFIDSSYLQMLLRFGLAYTLLAVYYFSDLIRRLFRQGLTTYGFVAVIFAIHGVIAHHLFNPIYNTLWLCFLASLTVQEKMIPLAIVGQLSRSETGLGQALDDFTKHAKHMLGEQHVVTLDITDNRQFLKNCWHILHMPALTYYFTPSATLWGNLRDLVYLKLMLYQGASVVTHFHTRHYGQLMQQHRALRWLNRRVYRRISLIILLGQSQRQMFDGFKLPVEKFRTIPNGIAPELFISEADYAQKTGKRVIYFSNFIEEKGYLTVLEAARGLTGSGYQFFFAGQFFNPAVKAQFLRLIEPLDDVYYIEAVKGQDKAWLLKQMDYFVLPTTYQHETLPISLLEAMASGLQLLVTPVGVIPEYANPAVTTWIEPNADQISSVLRAKLSEPKPLYSDLNLVNYQAVFNRTSVNQQILDAVMFAVRDDDYREMRQLGMYF